MIEQACDAGALDRFQIFGDRALALRREQIGDRVQQQIVAVIAKQRLGAAIGGMDIPGAIEHPDALGCGVEDRRKVLGVGFADHRRVDHRRVRDGGGWRSGGGLIVRSLGRREHQRERGFIVP